MDRKRPEFEHLQTIRLETVQRAYEVLVGSDLLQEIGPTLATRLGAGGRAVVCTDENVAPLYLAQVSASLSAAGYEVSTLVVPPGEQEKCVARLESLWECLYERGVRRRDLVVALGGGVIGDLVGLAAATFLRGVRLVQVPTTLLAMVDASVGGKVAVDYRDGKNYLGTFYQPWLVVGDVDTLATLPELQLRSGMAEVIKHGFIAGGGVLDDLEAAARGGRLPGVELVAANVAVKARVVTLDEREEDGPRATLNLGHTIGHAIEAAAGFTGYTHGEAVSLGLHATLWLSRRLSGLSAAETERGHRLLDESGLPGRLERVTPEAVLALVSRDKKTAGEGVGFVLLEAFGRPVTGCVVPRALQEEVVAWLTSR